MRTLLLTLLLSIGLTAQSKKEAKEIKKQERHERKMEKQRERTQKKITYLENPNWLKFDEKNPDLGTIFYDPRMGLPFSCSNNTRCVIKMIQIVSYWVPSAKKLEVNVIDPCDNDSFLNNIMIVIPKEDLMAIRRFRLDDIDTKEKLAEDYDGSMIPPHLQNKFENQIRQNCGTYLN
jgi:hypothetical protein